MIDEVLVFLKNQLNAYLGSGQNPDESQEEQVVFTDGQTMDPLSFKLGAVSVLLINIEEEHLLRPPNLYAQIQPNGAQQQVNPEIRLNLYVLFVARFKEYDESLRYLSRIIRYFQSNRVIDRQKAPGLIENIDRLVLELITLPFSEQNEVWSALRVPYQPSVLYKVKMVVYEDDEAETSAQIGEKFLQLSE